jgi:hypothetical protein
MSRSSGAREPAASDPTQPCDARRNLRHACSEDIVCVLHVSREQIPSKRGRSHMVMPVPVG